MAVLLKTGDGDIYAGETREACIQAVLKDRSDRSDCLTSLVEVPGDTRIRVEGDPDDLEAEPELSTLAEEYTEGIGAYPIASEGW